MNVNKPKRPFKYHLEKMVESLSKERRSASIYTIYCNRETVNMLNKALTINHISKIK